MLVCSSLDIKLVLDLFFIELYGSVFYIESEDGYGLSKAQKQPQQKAQQGSGGWWGVRVRDGRMTKLQRWRECLVCHLLRLESNYWEGSQLVPPPTPVNWVPHHNQINTSRITWTCLGIRGSGGARHGWCSEDNGAKFQTGAEDPGLMESKRRKFRPREADCTFAAL